MLRCAFKNAGAAIKRTLDGLWWRAVCMIETGGDERKCQAKGAGGVECYGPVASHHVGGRSNACRYELILGIRLCQGHHTESPEFSAHGTAEEFEGWLKVEFPEKHEKLCELRNVIRPEREMDYEKIRQVLSTGKRPGHGGQ